MPRKLESQVESRFMEVDKALERIRRTAGVNMHKLRKAERGPRANPARRFAVWALRNATQLTQAEIGDTLGMSSSQVAHVLRRLNAKEEPISSWIAEW